MKEILSIPADREKPGRRRASLVLLLLVTTVCLAAIVAADPARAAASPPAADSPSLTDWLSVGALWFTAGGVIVAALQIWISSKAAKIERTRGYQERYQADGFRESASLTIGCTEVRDAGECVAFIEAWSNRPDAMSEVLPQRRGDKRASVQDIERTLTLFEEMGSAHRRKQLDEKTIETTNAPVIIQVFTTAWWLICWLREGHLSNEGNQAGDVYVEFESMCKAIMKNLPTMMTDMELEPAAAIRALCIPHGCGREKVEGEAIWSNSRSLSLSLSAFVTGLETGRSLGDGLEGLAAEIEALHATSIACEGPAPMKWDVFIVPATIDQACDDEWRLQYSASIRLAQALDRCDLEEKLEAAVAHLAAIRS